MNRSEVQFVYKQFVQYYMYIVMKNQVDKYIKIYKLCMFLKQNLKIKILQTYIVIDRFQDKKNFQNYQKFSINNCMYILAEFF